MELRNLITVVILIIQLHEVIVNAGNLPKLKDNKLLVGDAARLPGPTVLVDCGRRRDKKGTLGTSLTPTESLVPLKFAAFGFTAGPLGSPFSPKVSGIGGKFKFVTVSAWKTMYALNIDESGQKAYWLPQGKMIDIPKHPNTNEPKYVFTPDFSGCSWTVTPMSNGYLRLRHVEGGKEGQQFNDLSVIDKGGETTYAMQYIDYGYTPERSRMLENVRGFAYMHYSEGRWNFHFQRQTCCPWPGGYAFKNGLLSGMQMTDNTESQSVSSTMTYTIP